MKQSTNARFVKAVLCAIGILVLILDAKTALQGASEGIHLCLYTIIPSLLPFFVLTMLLTGALIGSRIPFLKPLCIICRIPDGTESLLLTGMLGGYPTGAQLVKESWLDGNLDTNTAATMLVICNLAGPAFIFGIIAKQFSSAATVWILWIIHILSALLCARILPGTKMQSAMNARSHNTSLTDAVQRSIRVTALVCSWIILFRVILSFLRRWFLWLLPDALQVLVYGLLELANGCCELYRISSKGLRFVAAAGMLSFGGLCVTMQTSSVCQGLPFRRYIPGKLIQMSISIILALFAQKLLFVSSEQLPIPLLIPALLLLGALIMGVNLRKCKNSSRISPLVGV